MNFVNNQMHKICSKITCANVCANDIQIKNDST